MDMSSRKICALSPLFFRRAGLTSWVQISPMVVVPVVDTCLDVLPGSRSIVGCCQMPLRFQQLQHPFRQIAGTDRIEKRGEFQVCMDD